jgi:SAM-dependent methyltransferase
MLFSPDNPIPKDEFRMLRPILNDGQHMLELGNKKNGAGIYKKYFQKIGVDHVSVDWNGKNGSINLDLRELLEVFLDKWRHFFDIVTNFGTTEHVIPQGYVWNNILNALKIGGYFVSATPTPGNWMWHQKGGMYPTQEFYESFADNNGLEIIEMRKGKNPPRSLTYVVMKKLDFVQVPKIDKSLIYINE